MTYVHKKESLVVCVSMFIFITLSYLLYQQAAHKPHPHTDVDSKAYINGGELFHQDKSFNRLGYLPYYTLGYPFFIGMLYTLFNQNNLLIILIAQVLLSLLSGLLIFKTTRQLFGNKPALISSLLFSCNLGFLLFSQFILTEILLAFLLLLFFERFSHFLITKNLVALAGAGFTLGLSILIKPAAIYYPLCLVFFIIITHIRHPRESGDPYLKTIALFLIMFYIPIIGYRVHNKITFDSFSIGSLSEVNILFWFFPHVLAENNNTTSDHEREQLKKLERTHGLAGVRSFLWEQINHNPLIVMYAWLKNTFKTWFGLYAANLKILVDPAIFSGQFSFFRMHGSFYDRVKFYVIGNTNLYWVKVVGLLEFLWQSIRYLLVTIGIGYLLHKRQWMLLLFFLSYLSYFSLITGHDGCARFRMMFEGQLIMLSALGAWTLLSTRKDHI